VTCELFLSFYIACFCYLKLYLLAVVHLEIPVSNYDNQFLFANISVIALKQTFIIFVSHILQYVVYIVTDGVTVNQLMSIIFGIICNRCVCNIVIAFAKSTLHIMQYFDGFAIVIFTVLK